MIRFVSVVAVVTTALVIIASTGASGAETIKATPSTFASAVSSAQAGDTILLATGNYGTWSGTNKAITIKNDDGATPTMKFSFDTGDSGFTLDGMSGMGGDIANGANHITVRNSAFTSPTTIQGVSNGAILFDHDTFNNINSSDGAPPGRIWLPGSTPHPSGLTIQNSQFIGGSSDGVQAGTALTLLNNEFANIVHGSCGSCHTDNIQLYGGQAQDGVGSTIKGNYIHDGETGIVQFDGGGGHDIQNNVIARMSIFGMDFGGDENSKIIHNTQFQSVGNGLDMTSKAGQNSVGETIKDNVVKNIAMSDSDSAAKPAVNTNNMLISGASGSNFNGTPQFVGGSSPTTYAGFALASGSPGKGRASDGSDVGISGSGGSQPPDNPPPPPPPPPPGDNQPTAAYSYSPSAPRTGQAMSFDASTSACADTPCTYTWVDDGSDGQGGTDWPLGSGKTMSFTFQNAGTKNVRVTVADADGDSATTVKAITVTSAPANDTTPPDTTITAGPAGPTNDTTPSFSFTANESASTFECRVDSASWASCTSPWTTSALATGNHSVSVRATDAAGNTDASPATRAFSIDTTAPTTTITQAPPAQTDSGDASVAFTVNESGSMSECRLDGGGWSPCTSPYEVTGLAPGAHSVGVRSTDAAGNVESPGASASWTVGSGGPSQPPPTADAPPTVDLTAPAVGSTVSGRFRITADADDDHGIDHVEFWVGQTRLDRDTSEPYSDRVDASGWSTGTRTISVRAFDATGQSASSAETIRVSRYSRGSTSSTWAELTSTAGDGVTRLSGQAPRGSDVRVSLTACSSSRGTVVDQFTLHADTNGHLDMTYAGSNRCVLRLDPVSG
jgi:hypothetical protein